jgi:hypothetical protein
MLGSYRAIFAYNAGRILLLMRYTIERPKEFTKAAKNFDESKLSSFLMGSMPIKIFSVYDMDNESG